MAITYSKWKRESEISILLAARGHPLFSFHMCIIVVVDDTWEIVYVCTIASVVCELENPPLFKEHALQKDLTIVWCHFVWGVAASESIPSNIPLLCLMKFDTFLTYLKSSGLRKVKAKCRKGGILENIFFSTSHRTVQQEASSTTTEKCSTHSQRQTNGSSAPWTLHS